MLGRGVAKGMGRGDMENGWLRIGMIYIYV